MQVLIPVEVTNAMFLPGTTVPYPDTGKGEVMWASGVSVPVGEERVYDTNVYSFTGSAPTATTIPPSQDGKLWSYKRPANRYAPFDMYIGTKSEALGTLVLDMQVGFFRDVSLYGLEGDRVKIEVFASTAVGAPLLKSLDLELYSQALGLYELLFMPLQVLTQATLEDIPLSPTARLVITVSSGVPTNKVAIGKVSFGEWIGLIGESKFGGTEWGAQAEPKSYSYTRYNDDGTYVLVPRRSAVNMNFTVSLDANQAEYAMSILLQILDKPVAVRATDVPNYGYLSTVGVVTGNVVAENFSRAKLQISVKGFT